MIGSTTTWETEMSFVKKSIAIVVARRNASRWGKNVIWSELTVIRMFVVTEPFVASIWIRSIANVIAIITYDLFLNYTIEINTTSSFWNFWLMIDLRVLI